MAPRRCIGPRITVTSPQPQALLRARANPAAVTGTGMTPLALACEAGNEDLVRVLLKAAADAESDTRAMARRRLMMAARTGSVPVLEAAAREGRQDRGAREAARHDGADVGGGELERRRRAPADRERRGHQCALGDGGARSQAVSGAAGARAHPGIHRWHRAARRGRRGGRAGCASAGSAWRTLQPAAAAQRRFEAEIAVAKGAIAKFEQPAQYAREAHKQWGGLTPLLFAAREGNLETVKALLDAGADVNQTSEYGWTALLVATHNRFYQLGVYLLEHGADPNIANEGGWNPLYIATDNRNIEAGDYPTRKPDMDHLEYIRRLLAAGANPNLRMHSSTETRTVFTNQWLYEEGATPFLRAAQSGDMVLMKLLLEHGADPSTCDRSQGDAADGGERHRLGGGRDIRVVAAGDARRGEAAAGSGCRRECAGHARWPDGADGCGPQGSQ